MAVTETVKRVSISVLFSNGTDSQGNIKTLGISLGSLNPEAYDDDKAFAVISKLRPCISKVYYGTQKTTAATLVQA